MAISRHWTTDPKSKYIGIECQCRRNWFSINIENLMGYEIIKNKKNIQCQINKALTAETVM